ncbi:2-dehydro-3-deoxyphosphogluconate aldolase/(4S)-4-hydroxy-2-oxoglutarate aldolase [Alkalihalobacillus xiaoxiensis]|uniref:2-dehydro-3-deoxyphosphogluconate aldolase/(4S)-4-hydroxy-2-oxoglutarate aldolase n=1 Tax=Shouchella xiaoxiensis TaxID=766895 RepID=A0ABS2SWA3_9BACI|nr:bifunctional 4-hydroxy-2-oxoglutarate aldolase/2-dehydro-3-deoxy-phosphogluconate aldolase [Shouchella xiaoxiensis]MBM7839446.1 2-dehydro-3-deoxyphosphogluconate aldolase/(4S)-4-hydroxy-2-oxoglutarate aldolase [Shouchella xiaoxiensis]
MTILTELIDSGVCAVMRKLPYEKTEAIAKALLAGGVRGLEVTLDSDRPYEVITNLKQTFGDEALVGAGTVLNGEEAQAALDAGAQFIFSPLLSKEVIDVAKKAGVPVIPGIFTPTEAYQATQWGADMVKVFPADCVGPGFIKAVSGPLAQIKMMPTGGVDLDTIPSFIKAGAVAVGAGGALLQNTLIEQEDWQALEERAAAFVAKVEEARAN